LAKTELDYQAWQPGDVEEDDPSFVMGGTVKAGMVRAVEIVLEPAALDYSVYSLIFPDISTWQGDIDWIKMAAMTDVIVIRAGYGNDGIDPRVRENAAQAKLHGLKFGLYWYVKAGKDFRKHIESFKAICDELKPELTPVWDCEYTDYVDSIKNATTQWLAKLDLNWPLDEMIYTRATWWNANTSRTDWPKKRPLWVAHYTSADQPAIPDDWGKVAVPRTWTFWQYSADGNGLGEAFGVQSHSIDLNRYKGSVAEFEQEFDVKLGADEPDPDPDPDPEPEPGGSLQFRVAVDTLNVRNGPSIEAAKVGTLQKGDIVDCLNVRGSDAWVEIEEGKWCAAQYGTRVYLTKVEG